MAKRDGPDHPKRSVNSPQKWGCAEATGTSYSGLVATRFRFPYCASHLGCPAERELGQGSTHVKVWAASG